MVRFHARRTHRRRRDSRDSRDRGFSCLFRIRRRRQGCRFEIQRPFDFVGHPFRVRAYGKFPEALYRPRRFALRRRALRCFCRNFRRTDLSYLRQLERSEYQLFRWQSRLDGIETRRFEIQDREVGARALLRRSGGGLRREERHSLSGGFFGAFVTEAAYGNSSPGRGDSAVLNRVRRWRRPVVLEFHRRVAQPHPRSGAGFAHGSPHGRGFRIRTEPSGSFGFVLFGRKFRPSRFCEKRILE